MTQVQTVPEILQENEKLFDSKNDDYGNSRQLSGEICDLLIEGDLELTTQQEYIIFGLQTRLLDKLIRSMHLQWNKDDPDHESLVDTYKDLSNYAAMLAHEEQRRQDQEMGPMGKLFRERDVTEVELEFTVDDEVDQEIRTGSNRDNFLGVGQVTGESESNGNPDADDILPDGHNY